MTVYQIKDMEDGALTEHISSLREALRKAELELYSRKILQLSEHYGVKLGESVIRVKGVDFAVASMEDHLTKFDDNPSPFLVLRKITKKGGLHGNLQYLFTKDISVVGKYKAGTKGEVQYDK